MTPPRPGFFALAAISLLVRPWLSASADPLPDGHALFEVQCAPCHGPGGEGGRGPTLARPRLPRAPDEAAIVKIIASGIPGTEMPQFHIGKERIQAIADWVWKLGRLPPEIVPGDPRRGAALYRTRGNCALCHQLGGYGGAIGPDLTDVGLRRSAAYLRTSLVDPGADVPKSFESFRSDVNIRENFVMVAVTTRDGRQLAGVRVNEDTFSIQLRDFGGQLHSFFKSDLADVRKEWGQSPMPSYAAFAPDEIDDLVAFLAAQKGTP
jgi:cytochrome c oxidase cbb3-type subunit III